MISNIRDMRAHQMMMGRTTQAAGIQRAKRTLMQKAKRRQSTRLLELGHLRLNLMIASMPGMSLRDASTCCQMKVAIISNVEDLSAIDI